MTVDKLRIAWFSDMILPQTVQSSLVPQSLSAYFTAKILPQLKDSCDITLYVNSFKKHPDFPTYHYLKAAEHDNNRPFDIFFYQLEDDARSNFVRSHIGLIPGITYFHHFNLTNYGPEPLLNSPYQEIVEKFNHATAEWPDRAKKFEPKGPAAYREAALSSAVVFSNPHSLNEYKHLVKLKLEPKTKEDLNAFFLPYPIEAQPAFVRKQNPKFNIALMASARVECRPHKVLEAVKNLNFGHQLDWLVPPSQASQAAALIEEYEITTAKIHYNYNPEYWMDLVVSADCAIHPLFSAYGHLEPFLGCSLTSGCPVMVSNFGSAEYLPDNLVIKIQPGDNEALQIESALKALRFGHVKIDHDLLRSFATETYTAKQVAIELLAIFEQKKDLIRETRERWAELEKQARKSLVDEAYLYAPDTANMISEVFQELGWTQ